MITTPSCKKPWAGQPRTGLYLNHLISHTQHNAHDCTSHVRLHCSASRVVSLLRPCSTEVLFLSAVLDCSITSHTNRLISSVFWLYSVTVWSITAVAAPGTVTVSSVANYLFCCPHTGRPAKCLPARVRAVVCHRPPKQNLVSLHGLPCCLSGSLWSQAAAGSACSTAAFGALRGRLQSLPSSWMPTAFVAGWPAGREPLLDSKTGRAATSCALDTDAPLLAASAVEAADAGAET